MTSFGIGDKVTWTSQAGGRVKEKMGVVYDVIKNTHQLWETGDRLKKSGTHQVKFDGYSMLAPVVYFVEVKGGQKAKPKMYLPRPKQLKLVEAE